jgi:hypothetical protein
MVNAPSARSLAALIQEPEYPFTGTLFQVPISAKKLRRFFCLITWTLPSGWGSRGPSDRWDEMKHGDFWAT